MVAMWLGYDGPEKANQLATGNAHTRALQQRSDELGRALTLLRDPGTRPAVSRRGANQRGAHSLSILDPVGCSSPRICLPWPRAAICDVGYTEGTSSTPSGLFRPDATGSASASSRVSRPSLRPTQ